jgi:hypothetical protein
VQVSDRLAEVRLRCEDHPNEVLTIGRPAVGASGVDTVPITLEANGLTCSHSAVTYGNDGIPAFFAGMAADWRGWAGARVLRTLEEDLEITATHTGRRVELAITMRRGRHEDGWRVSLTMSLSPGETLSHAAHEIAELFTDL